MADFVQNSATKSAVRKLASPIANVAAFNTIVDSVITGNPFACVAYMTAGTNHQPVEKNREAYSAHIVYQDSDAKIVCTDSARYNPIAGFNAGITATLAGTAITAAHAGMVVIHDVIAGSGTCTLEGRAIPYAPGIVGVMPLTRFTGSR
ncbi:MAG: hypothetical protein WC620_02540 [Methanoregula sp.]|jgi:hypothetical protein